MCDVPACPTNRFAGFIGDLILEHRQEAGLTLDQLGDLTGLSVKRLIELQRGVGLPMTVFEMWWIARVLEVDVCCMLPVVSNAVGF